MWRLSLLGVLLALGCKAEISACGSGESEAPKGQVVFTEKMAKALEQQSVLTSNLVEYIARLQGAKILPKPEEVVELEKKIAEAKKVKQ